MNTKSDATDDIISEAKKDIELILEGKKVGINNGATTAYLQYISDFILDNSDDLKPDKKATLEAYFEKHVPIAMRNAEAKQFRDEELLKQQQARAMLGNPKTAPNVTIGAPLPGMEVPPRI